MASIRLSEAGGRPESGNFHGRGFARNATLKMIMATAYQVPGFEISGGPAWTDSQRFDIEGRAEDPNAGYVQLRLMMQSLLEDRFHLRLHRETRSAPVYMLEVSRSGAKMRRSADQASPEATGPAATSNGDPPRGSLLSGPGLLEGSAVPMQSLMKVLASQAGRPVIDNTDLDGRYDIRLAWAPERIAGAVGGNAGDATDLPDLFTALREQLGLGLRASRGPVEFLVIDAVQKPSPN